MTFYYIEDQNVLEGNNGSDYAEVDDSGNLRIDVNAIMDGRGIEKLEEMIWAIENAIEANE